MKRIYLVFCAIGTAVPYYFLLSFIAEYGLNVPLLFQQLFANDISTFFAADLVLSVLVFWAFLYAETKRIGARHVWTSVVATLLVGLSLSLPLFLYLRELRLAELAQHKTATGSVAPR